MGRRECHSGAGALGRGAGFRPARGSFQRRGGHQPSLNSLLHPLLLAVDFGVWSLVEEKKEARPRRTDHTFTFERPEPVKRRREEDIVSVVARIPPRISKTCSLKNLYDVSILEDVARGSPLRGAGLVQARYTAPHNLHE